MPDPSSRDARLERLVLAGLALTSEPSLDAVIERVAEIAAEVIGAKYAAIGVLAPDGRLLERFTTYGLSAAEQERIGPRPTGHGILGLVIREGRPIRLPDLARHPDSSGFPPHHPPMHSFLGVPIAGRRGAFGNLYLTEKLGAEAFTEEDEHIAVLLAAMTSAAVENARLHGESARLLAEVHQLQRTRERFFAMVNHELRNALAAVYGWSEMLVRRKNPADVPPAAREVLEAAEQAVGLITDLLDLSRLDEDRLRPDIRTVDPGAIVKRAVARVLPNAHAKGLLVPFELPRDLPTIDTDASRVEQILVNLLTNAVKHSPRDGMVRVTARPFEERVAIVVEDQGPGIAEEDAEAIFDIYVTRDDGANKHGVGLGLPLSRRLARLLGGELGCIPRAGSGVFVLELPRHHGTAPTGPTPDPRTPPR